MTAPGEIELNSLTPLFASPLLSFALLDTAALNAGLLGEIAARRTSEPSLQRSNRGGWHSADDLFRRPEPAQRELADRMREAARKATLALQPAARFDGLRLEAEGWINVNPPDALNAPHDHPGWLWSGCYYVQVPESNAAAAPTDGCIEFLDSRTNLRVISVVDMPFMRSKTQVRPAPGLLLLFPAHLMHWVYPHPGPGERISVAFNARWSRG